MVAADDYKGLAALANKAHPSRVRREVWQGQSIWIKKATRAKATVFHRIQRVICSLIPVEGFRPTVSSGGAEALRHEAARIAELKAAGFLVPEVVAISDDWIVLSDLGDTVDRFLHKQSPDVVGATITACARELASLHNAGMYHGRAKLNDFVYTRGEQVGFIDFEENLSHLKREAVHAREIWLFLGCVSEYSAVVPDIMETALGAYQQHRADADYSELKKMLALLRLFTSSIFLVRRALSKDVNHAYDATQFLIRSNL